MPLITRQALGPYSFSMSAVDYPAAVKYWSSIFWWNSAGRPDDGAITKVLSFPSLSTLTGRFQVYAYDREPVDGVFPIYATEYPHIPLIAKDGSSYSFNFATKTISMIGAEMTLQEWTDLFDTGHIPDYNTYSDWYYRIDRYLRVAMPPDEYATLADIASFDLEAGRMDAVAYEYLRVGFGFVAAPTRPKAKIVVSAFPVSVAQGEEITGEVEVQNVGERGGNFNVEAELEGVIYVLLPLAQSIAAGGRATFTPVGLRMPNRDVTLYITAWSYDGVTWRADDTWTVPIFLEAAPPPPPPPPSEPEFANLRVSRFDKI